MNRFYYSESISDFLKRDKNQIIGILSKESSSDIVHTQIQAWDLEIKILKDVLETFSSGRIYFEYSIPRMGKRVDVLLLIKSVVFVLEFKVGEHRFDSDALDQVWDYSLDLKNFHSESLKYTVAPILIATSSRSEYSSITKTHHNDGLLYPIKSSVDNLENVIKSVIDFSDAPNVIMEEWNKGHYQPTPNIIEAAMALYNNHSVKEITRSDAGAINLSKTSDTISEIIADSIKYSKKSICFVTGVPGAGKTLIGLNIATKHIDKDSDLYSVYLSGNGPLVAILREALTRDRYIREKMKGKKVKKGEIKSEVKIFIQNVHNFRDECLIEPDRAPLEHVALFDEAQRAWNKDETTSFMKRKKDHPDFNLSEPEFLISCLDRHKDWAVIVCLVGGGQEINRGEAGIREWLDSLDRSYPHWDRHISPNLTDSEYGLGGYFQNYRNLSNSYFNSSLHLSVSLRSFRAENLSLLVKYLLDIKPEEAAKTYSSIKSKYPIMLTRNLAKAKSWLKLQARGSERYGLIVSSQAYRLKPHAIDVKTPVDPIHWFLDGKDDIRSSYYMEDVVTEFAIQGLELDWACVTWDADLRYSNEGWKHFSFVGSKWHKIKKEERKNYLKNAYRVLLTRARQGMVVVVPEGNDEDHTRKCEYYDATYHYLKDIGFVVI